MLSGKRSVLESVDLSGNHWYTSRRDHGDGGAFVEALMGGSLQAAPATLKSVDLRNNQVSEEIVQAYDRADQIPMVLLID
jgi:hypothetical protein